MGGRSALEELGAGWRGGVVVHHGSASAAGGLSGDTGGRICLVPWSMGCAGGAGPAPRWSSGSDLASCLAAA